MNINNKNKILLSLLSGVIFYLGWTQLHIGWVVLFGFIPLLFIKESFLNSNRKNKTALFFFYSFIAFATWNSLSTWWIYHATLPGAIAAIVLSSLFKSTTLALILITSLNFGRRLGYIAFVSFWLSFEYIFMNSDISWPWLILGNAFANNIKMIQWYEFTGHFGGSLWVLVINLLIFEIIRFFIDKIPAPVIRKYSILLAIIFIIPVTYSFIRYYTYSEKEKPVDVVVIQPNIDSYVEKFQTPAKDQILNIIELAESKADPKVDYFVAPETAIPFGMWESQLNSYENISLLREFINNYPEAVLVIGADTRRRYESKKTITARPLGSSGNYYYDIFNTALQIDTAADIQIYHKSKLVPGVEMLPYPRVFGVLSDMMLDLGGMSGSHGTQEERTVMKNRNSDMLVGVPICYESVYGGFYREWVKNGADIMFVITNDGWWEDTPGYRQHHSFSRIRAIETRRSIARSANTGISSFINQRGDVLESLGWDVRGAIRQKINANDSITFYVKYGDYIPRMSLIFTVILLGLQLVNKVFKKIKAKNGQ